MPRDRVATLQEARSVYVAYGALLCEAGVYSTTAIAASLARALWGRQVAPPVIPGDTLAIHDSSGASGLLTLHHCQNDAARIDISPARVLGLAGPMRRVKMLGALLAVVPWPRRFFERLFDIYSRIGVEVSQASRAAAVIAANERSLGCAPFLAAAKFRCDLPVQVIQHGNPSCDYLPTVADAYLCRSDRWFEYLRGSRLVERVERIDDFPTLTALRFDPGTDAVALVLHNIGYLEPEIDYVLLTRRIAALCTSAGCRLFVLPHPANPQHFGYPVIDRDIGFAARLVVGYRSTAADQVSADMPRVSMLDDWPEFFLKQPMPGRIEAFVARIEAALTT